MSNRKSSRGKNSVEELGKAIDKQKSFPTKEPPSIINNKTSDTTDLHMEFKESMLVFQQDSNVQFSHMEIAFHKMTENMVKLTKTLENLDSNQSKTNMRSNQQTLQFLKTNKIKTSKTKTTILQHQQLPKNLSSSQVINQTPAIQTTIIYC